MKKYDKNAIPHLSKVAFGKCDSSCEVATSALQHRSHVLTMECSRRARLNKVLQLNYHMTLDYK